MKNIDILPGNIVPIQIRKQVYKEVLVYLHKNTKPFLGKHLCLILPCFLWGLSTYLEQSPSGKDWDIFQVPEMFPDLKKGLKKIEEAPLEKKLELRIKLIKSKL